MFSLLKFQILNLKSTPSLEFLQLLRRNLLKSVCSSLPYVWVCVLQRLDKRGNRLWTGMLPEALQAPQRHATNVRIIVLSSANEGRHGPSELYCGHPTRSANHNPRIFILETGQQKWH